MDIGDWDDIGGSMSRKHDSEALRKEVQRLKALEAEHLALLKALKEVKHGHSSMCSVCRRKV